MWRGPRTVIASDHRVKDAPTTNINDPNVAGKFKRPSDRREQFRRGGRLLPVRRPEFLMAFIDVAGVDHFVPGAWRNVARRPSGSMISVRSSVTLSTTWTVMHGFLDSQRHFSRRSIRPVRSQTTINGISDSGTVVGFFVDASWQHDRAWWARRCPSLPLCCSSALDCSELVYCAAGAVEHSSTRLNSLPCGSRMPVLNTKWEQVDDL